MSVGIQSHLRPGPFYLVAAAAILACAGPPQAPAPDESSLFGHLRLVPREGLDPSKSASGVYGDRRLRDVELVDYSQPGFAVVYLEQSNTGAAGGGELSIRNTGILPRLTPAFAAAAMGAEIRIANQTEVTHILSCPKARIVQSIAPGKSLSFELSQPGEYNFYLLDVPGSHSQIFAAPGRFTVVSDSGRFELTRLTPGHARLRTWHPRFPPISRAVELTPGEVTLVDLEIGVGRPDEAHDVAP
jgi:hypothetical protein